MSEYENESITNLEYQLNDVYFANETWAGWVIDFSYNNGEIGYAIVFKVNDVCKLVEISFDENSPYYDKTGLYIYPSLGYYYIKQGDTYYNAKTLEIRNYAAQQEDLFYAAMNSDDKAEVEETLSINYKNATYTHYEIGSFFTTYSTSLVDLENHCATVAGLIMLNYWNKKHNNDILKLEYSGNIPTEEAKTYIKTFYNYMHVNWLFGVGGTLPNECYDGFERLIQEHGYRTSRNTGLDYTAIKNSIQAGIPVFITSTNYYFTDYPHRSSLPSVNSTSGNYTLSINYEHTWGVANSHTFVGYGYAYYNITQEKSREVWSPTWSDPFRTVTEYYTETFTEEFIKVADGWNGSCYYNYSQSNNFSVAAINVYK